MKIYDNLRFETFHFGVKCYISSLSKNYITLIDSRSKLEEYICFLHRKEIDHKKQIIQQQISVMAPVTLGKHLYGFEYFATSRTLHNCLIKYHQLPSITTLTRITSKVAKIPENTFPNSVFKSLDTNQKLCVVFRGEVYIKEMLLYHGGSIFGKSVDDPSSLARIILGMMIICLWWS